MSLDNYETAGRTSSITRYKRAIAELAREQFWRNPECAAEKIAQHYCAHALIALQLAELVKMNRHHPCESFESAIKYLADKIMEDHLADFGTHLIPLKPL